MKKLLSILICFILVLSVFSFVGCTSVDYGDRISQIEQDNIKAQEDAAKAKSDADKLAAELADAKTEAAQQLQKIERLESELAKSSESITDLQELVGTLTATVESLKDAIEALPGGSDNTLVLQKIAALETEVGTLKTKVSTLEAAVAALETEVTALKTDLAAAEARIAILEGIAGGGGSEPTVYEVGVAGKDTFTFVNNGIKLFSVRLDVYDIPSTAPTNVLEGILINYCMPPTLVINTYLDIFAYYDNGTAITYYSSRINELSGANKDQPTDFFFAFNTFPPQVTGFYLGIPNGTANSFIPYAHFILPKAEA